MSLKEELSKLNLPSKFSKVSFEYAPSDDFLGHSNLDDNTVEINDNFDKFGLTKEHELYAALHELGHLDNRAISFILSSASLCCSILSLFLLASSIVFVILYHTLMGLFIGLILALLGLLLLSGFYSFYFLSEIQADDFARSKLTKIKKERLFYEATEAIGEYRKPNPGLCYRLFYFLVSKKEVAERYKSRKWFWLPKLPF